MEIEPGPARGWVIKHHHCECLHDISLLILGQLIHCPRLLTSFFPTLKFLIALLPFMTSFTFNSIFFHSFFPSFCHEHIFFPLSILASLFTILSTPFVLEFSCWKKIVLSPWSNPGTHRKELKPLALLLKGYLSHQPILSSFIWVGGVSSFILLCVAD